MNIQIRPMTKDELDIMLAEENSDRAHHELTPSDLAPILRYIEHKIKPGSFITAVLCNDLKEAAGRADINNRRKLFEYVEWLYNNAPADCWGSTEQVTAWLNKESL